MTINAGSRMVHYAAMQPSHASPRLPRPSAGEAAKPSEERNFLTFTPDQMVVSR